MLARPTSLLFATLALLITGTEQAWAQSAGSGPGLGQPRRAGTATWLALTSDTRLADHWGAHAEVQGRRTSGGAARQNLLRLGINYHASAALVFSAGYAHVLTFPSGDFSAVTQLPEHRVYEQLQLHDSHGRLQLLHRYRLEQRWVQLADQPAPVYLNRIRYQLRLTYPLSAPTLQPGGAYLVAADELFLGFGANVQHGIFDQNRAYAAVGYQISKALALEAGYLNQLLQPYSATDFGSMHSVQIGLTFNPEFRPTGTLASAQPQ
ncbi:DUF2490 domain-containing protein [Hymenobacter metallicola]|uniref:DUF2490 domain-containing protein n=1 Tax=Hymenobacter metallicola TaxID=2563114 RepID=A0A4Z0QAK0_9BACT|nr:DUF2490 domain-containing protein [Hymenobacter metallicola]TGE27050.1 DUF2490 domain-containing protein [Hymenobacter metallicola]